MRGVFRLVTVDPPLELRALELLSPSTVSVAAPVLLGIPPRRPETLTPAAARERHGILSPREEYARFRGRHGEAGRADDAALGDAAVVAASRADE